MLETENSMEFRAGVRILPSKQRWGSGLHTLWTSRTTQADYDIHRAVYGITMPHEPVDTHPWFSY